MLIIPHVACKINYSACNLIRKCIKLGSKQLNKVNIQYKYEVSTHKIMQDSTNTRDLDKKFVQTPRTQLGYMGKFSILLLF